MVLNIKEYFKRIKVIVIKCLCLCMFKGAFLLKKELLKEKRNKKTSMNLVMFISGFNWIVGVGRKRK